MIDLGIVVMQIHVSYILEILRATCGNFWHVMLDQQHVWHKLKKIDGYKSRICGKIITVHRV